ncbi:MAG: thiamine pyrophosphate-binding protein [Bacillota bacterium]
MGQINGGKIVVDTLESLNVESIFGIPGIHNLDIYDALINSKIKHVTARHEQGAGYMADGYARITGKPGIALVITGPGLTNIITPMGQAFHDSIPMVVISSQVPTWALDQRVGFLHELKNSTILTKSVAKDSRMVSKVGDIGIYLKEAYYLSLSGRPGPVHVEIPMDILRDAAEESYANKENRTPSFSKIINIDPRLLELSINKINKSSKPVIIVGGGGCKAHMQIKQLAERINGAVVQTCAGKGVVDEEHPLCLGTRIHFQAVRQFLKTADLVIAVGTELSPTDLWEVPLQLDGEMIQIDVDAANFNRNFRAHIGLKGDAERILNLLLTSVSKKKRNNAREEELKEIIELTQTELSETTGISEGLEHISSMLSEVRKFLPHDGIIFTDMTTPAYIALSSYSCNQPKTFIHPVGFGTLGYALPAAIGAKITKRDKKICVLVGDGGFQFTCQELAVACQEKLTLPIIIWNDNGFGEIRRHQERRHPGQRIAVDHLNPDFIKLAEAYGIKGTRVNTPSELANALREAFLQQHPVIIEVRCGR